MMGKICVHYDDEVSRSMLHAVDVGSAFERKQGSLEVGKDYCNEYNNFNTHNLPRPNFFALGRRS